jgi:hypothetical protein
MLLVDTDDDCIIVPKDQCIRCIESKLNLHVYKSYSINKDNWNDEVNKKIVRAFSTKCTCSIQSFEEFNNKELPVLKSDISGMASKQIYGTFKMNEHAELVREMPMKKIEKII